MNHKIAKLNKGEIVISREPGNSMVPLLKSRQAVKLAPVKLEDIKVGDIVYCRVRGKNVTHLVTALDPRKGCQISNNQGFVNGWTKQIHGKVIEILQEGKDQKQ